MLKSDFSYRGYQGVDLVDDKLVLQKVGSPAPIFRSRSKPVGTVELGKHEIYEIYFSSRGFGWQSRGLHIVTKSRTYVAASDHCLSLDFQEIVMRWLGVAGLQRIRRNSLVRKLSGLLILILVGVLLDVSWTIGWTEVGIFPMLVLLLAGSALLQFWGYSRWLKRVSS